MTDHTPKPCGCRVQHDLYDPKRDGIVYCPTHAAAPALLAALREEHYRWQPSHRNSDFGRGCGVCDLIIVTGDAAIATAKEDADG